jgi:hypothetical protein
MINDRQILDTSAESRRERMTTVRVGLRRDLIDELMRDSDGLTLTTLLNSALKISLKHKAEITKDAKDAKYNEQHKCRYCHN